MWSCLGNAGSVFEIINDQGSFISWNPGRKLKKWISSEKRFPQENSSATICLVQASMHRTAHFNSLRPKMYRCMCQFCACSAPVRRQAIIKPMIPNYIGFWTLRNKLQWNLHQDFIQENEFENDVCDMVAIMSRPQCVWHQVSCASLYMEARLSSISLRSPSVYCGWSRLRNSQCSLCRCTHICQTIR